MLLIPACPGCLDDEIHVPTADPLVELHPIGRDLASITAVPGTDARFLIESATARVTVAVPLDRVDLRTQLEETVTIPRRQGDHLLWYGRLPVDPISLVRPGSELGLLVASLEGTPIDAVPYELPVDDAVRGPDGRWFVAFDFGHVLRIHTVTGAGIEGERVFIVDDTWLLANDGTRLAYALESTLLVVRELSGPGLIQRVLPVPLDPVAFGPDPDDLLLVDDEGRGHRIDLDTGETSSLPIDVDLRRAVWNDHGIQTLLQAPVPLILTIDPETGAATTEPAPIIEPRHGTLALAPGLPDDRPLLIRDGLATVLFDVEARHGSWYTRASRAFEFINDVAVSPDGAAHAIAVGDSVYVIHEDGDELRHGLEYGIAALHWRAPDELLVGHWDGIDVLDPRSGSIEPLVEFSSFRLSRGRIVSARDGSIRVGTGNRDLTGFIRIDENGETLLEPTVRAELLGMVSFAHPILDDTGPLAFVFDGDRTAVIVVDDPRIVLPADVPPYRPVPVTLHPTRRRLVGVTRVGRSLVSFPFVQVGEP